MFLILLFLIYLIHANFIFRISFIYFIVCSYLNHLLFCFPVCIYGGHLLAIFLSVFTAASTSCFLSAFTAVSTSCFHTCIYGNSLLTVFYNPRFFLKIKYALTTIAAVKIQETGYTSISISKVCIFLKIVQIHSIRKPTVPMIVITAGTIA